MREKYYWLTGADLVCEKKTLLLVAVEQSGRPYRKEYNDPSRFEIEVTIRKLSYFFKLKQRENRWIAAAQFLSKRGVVDFSKKKNLSSVG